MRTEEAWYDQDRGEHLTKQEMREALQRALDDAGGEDPNEVLPRSKIHRRAG